MKKILAFLLVALLLAGCTGNQNTTVKEVNMAQLYAKMEAKGIPEMVEVGADMMLSLYGIEQADVKQAKVTISGDGLLADEFWLIEAVSAEAAARIKTLADNRIDQKDAESVTYSPEQNAVVKKSYVAVEGNYVFLITSPKVEDMKKIVNDALGK